MQDTQAIITSTNIMLKIYNIHFTIYGNIWMYQQESAATVGVDDADLYNVIDENSRRMKRSTVSRRRQRMRGAYHS